MKEEHARDQTVETTRKRKEDSDVLAEVRIKFEDCGSYKQAVLLIVIFQSQPGETHFQICRSDQQLTLENPAQLIEPGVRAEVPRSDVLQVERNVVLQQKDLVFFVERRKGILGESELRQTACDRAELRNEAALVQRSELLVHLDQVLRSLGFEVELAGGEGEGVEDVAQLTVGSSKIKNVPSLLVSLWGKRKL